MKTVMEYLAEATLEALRQRAERSALRARDTIAATAYSLQTTDHLLYRKALEQLLQRVEQKLPQNPTEEDRIEAIVSAFFIVGCQVIGATLDQAAHEAASEAGAGPAIPRTPVAPDRFKPGNN